MQNLTAIQLSCDWKAEQAHNFPTDLILTLATELAAYDAHNEKVAEHRTADGVSQAMLVKKIADLEMALKAKADVAEVPTKPVAKKYSSPPAFNPATPEIYSGPGHARKGGVRQNGQPYTPDDEYTASHLGLH